MKSKGILVHRPTNDILIPTDDYEYATTVSLTQEEQHFSFEKAPKDPQIQPTIPPRKGPPENVFKHTRPSSSHKSPHFQDAETISFQFKEDPNQSLQADQSTHKGSKTNHQSARPKNERQNSVQKGVRTEKMSLVCHLMVVVLCITITSLMAKLTTDWSLRRRRCPLYVPNVPSIDIYWGNERMVACHYPAYMPIVVLLLSLSVALLNAGLINSQNRETPTSRLLVSFKYPLVMFYLMLCQSLIALSVACVLTDGMRVTCLTFQLNPWPDERPNNCKAGYYERDDTYGLQNSYGKILGSVVLSWIVTALLIFSTIVYLRRCRCCTGS